MRLCILHAGRVHDAFLVARFLAVVAHAETARGMRPLAAVYFTAAARELQPYIIRKVFTSSLSYAFHSFMVSPAIFGVRWPTGEMEVEAVGALINTQSHVAHFVDCHARVSRI